MKKYISLLLVAIVFSSCATQSEDPYNSIECVPFKSESNGRWGLIDSYGDPLFEAEFKYRPTFAINGRFMVPTTDEQWEIFTAEDEPQLVGDKYKSIGSFFEDVTPAAKEGEWIKLINRDGETVTDLKKLSGKKVIAVSQFHEGRAIFRTDENLYGAIDINGNVIVQPRFYALTWFHDGIAFGIDKKYQSECEYNDYENVKITMVGLDGGVINSFAYNKYTSDWKFVNGVMAVCPDDNSDKKWGLINKDLEWELKPHNKVYGIDGIRGDYFIYANSDGEYGLMDFDGKIAIKARYRKLRFAADNRLFARDSDGDWAMLDLNGDQVGHETFEACGVTFFGKGNHAIVRTDDNEYSFISADGNFLEMNEIDLYRIGDSFSNDWIYSDYSSSDHSY